MKYYVDYDRNKYKTLEDYRSNNSYGKISSKELWEKEPRLVIFNKEKIKIYTNEEIQMLYLYPLNILDYIKGIHNQTSKHNSIMFNVLHIDKRIDYSSYFQNLNFDLYKNTEFLIDKKYQEDDIKAIIKSTSFLKKKNTLISFNLKTLDISDELLIALAKTGDYFKITLDYILKSNQYKQFLKKLSLISNNISKNAMIHIKTYLNLNEVDSYEKALADFKELRVDIFQVSKELIPIDKKNNQVVDIKIQNMIRTLEIKNQANPKFLSVKNISTLYYPRFELDERNSKNCYACHLKPYLLDEMILPCKVHKVITNQKEWQLSDLKFHYDNKIISKCGKVCDDCASIFENDILEEITKILTPEAEVLLEVGDNE